MNKALCQLVRDSWVVLAACVLPLQSAHAHHLISTLGWVTRSGSCCGGYFSDTLSHARQSTRSEIPLHVTVRGKSYVSLHTPSVLHNATLEQGQHKMWADTVRLYPHPSSSPIFQHIELKNNVHYQEPGYRLLSDSMSFDLKQQRITFHNVWFRVASDPHHWIWGHADDGFKRLHGAMVLQHVKVSLCAPSQNSWHLKARRLWLNPYKGQGHAYGAQWVVHHVPIVYLPYMTFPLDQRRTTGFLTPSLSRRTIDGWVIKWPFYWNIAPSDDMLITSVWMQKRGWLFDGVLRYLTPNSVGRWQGMWMAHDQQFIPKTQRSTGFKSAHRQRWALSLEHHSHWNTHWTSNLTLKTASDDDFYLDFFPQLNFFHNTQLLNQVDVTYEGRHTRLLAQMQYYRTLHPAGTSVVPQLYRLWPRLSGSVHFKSKNYPIYYKFTSEYTYFNHKPSWVYGIQPVTGSRFYGTARMRSPQQIAHGLITPEVMITYTDYHLKHIVAQQNPDIHRLIPVFNIDGRWHFERHLTWHHRRYIQTLEPHFFYVWIPEHTQKTIPLFDTTTLPIHYAYLFLAHRLTGIDRWIDAHQLSWGLTTRWFTSSMRQEVLRLSLGHVIPFHQPHVSLGVHPTATQNMWSFEFKQTLSPYCDLMGTWGWAYKHNGLENSSLTVDIHRGPARRIVFSYDLIHQNPLFNTVSSTGQDTSYTHHFNIAFQWPLFSQLHFVSHIDYNMRQHHTEQFAYALTYRSCCWSLTLGADHNVLGLSSKPYRRSFFVKIQLKGLGGSL